MSQNVRVAFGALGDAAPLRWPNRCAMCARKTALRPVPIRAGRVTSVRPTLLGQVRVQSQILRLAPPLCPRHAARNRAAALLLDNGPAMRVIRVFGYMLAPIGLVTLLGLALGRGANAPERPLAILALGFIGLAVTAAALWARRAQGVRITSVDADDDVLALRFADDAYAEAFRRANPALTDGALTAPRPWWRRSAIPKALLVTALIVFIALLSRRA